MKYLLFFLFHILVFNLITCSLKGQKATFSGFVQDVESGEKIIGARISVPDKLIGTYTNSEGFFSLELPEDSSYRITTQYTGYVSDTLKLIKIPSSSLIISLSPSFTLETVDIVAPVSRPGKLSLSVDQVKQLPALGGEVDVMRAFQLLPGISGGNEGTAALYVRGGSPDQNLVLLDDAPLYYVNHIGGFLSIFDPNTIKQIQLIKGGFPARYGGRLSSVLEVYTKDGHKDRINGNLRLSFLSSGLTLEGPLSKKGKTTFLFSARRSFIDLFTRLATRLSSSGELSAGYAFYDLNGKITHHISDKDIISSTYHGQDQYFLRSDEEEGDPLNGGEIFRFKSKTKLNWGNTLGSFRWNHFYNNKLHGKIILGYTRFHYLNSISAQNIDIETDTIAADFLRSFRSSVKDIFIKKHLDWYPSIRHHVEIGSHITYHRFEPNNSSFNRYEGTSDTVANTNPQNLISAWELSAYIADTWWISSKISFDIGFHLTSFFIDSKRYTSIQPRLLLNSNISDRLGVSLSYSKMQQALHLLSNNSAGFPTDLWVPATANVAPQQSWQSALTISYQVDNQRSWFMSFEGFYKRMNQLIDFEEGSNIFGIGNNWEEKIVQGGLGEVYGSEWLSERRKGKFTGWIGYTLAWNWRKFSQISNGTRFPYTYDRRHDITVVANYTIKENISLSANWNYASGRAITLAPGFVPSLAIDFTQNGPLNYGLQQGHLQPQRNNFRIPAYHRLDIGVNFVKEFSNKKGSRVWRLGLYNAYWRLNPYFLYLENDLEEGLKLYQYSLFPLLPSISYERTF